jgi:hypothetical protein
MKLKCIKPTKTLTEGKMYQGALLKNGKTSYLNTENLEDAALFVVFNSDNGKRISCKSNRFIQTPKIDKVNT